MLTLTSGNSGITLGHASLGSALLEVQSGGEVSFPVSTTTVRSAATLSVAGSFSTAGPTNVDGGRVNLAGGQMEATTITLTNGGQFNFTAGGLTVNTFSGDLVNQAGRLTPGGSG